MLEIKGLSKSFNSHQAVAGIDLEVKEGEIFGLLGPNGAGKSTTISMISGLIRPNAGSIKIGGHDVFIEPLVSRRLMGVVPQDIALYPTLTARENLAFWGRMYGLSGAPLKQRVDEVLSLVGLADRANDRIEKYSGGMKRRINIGAGLMHRPKLLLMDEPTVGIDPQSRNHILDTVRELNKAGTSVLYTSHYMEEVEELCDRIAIMDQGRVMACGTLNELRLLVGDKDVITIQAKVTDAQVVEALRGIPGVDGVSKDEGQVHVVAPYGRKVLGDVVTRLAAAGVKVRSIDIKEPDLEGVFLHLTGKALRD
ncbi:MAG TPA: ABC transporter ATP-binding protein [Bacillota bacterium]